MIHCFICFDRGDAKSGLKHLTQAIQIAQECFYRWGLVPPEAQLLEQKLLREGALATKLTGAGGGGMVVALWE